MITEEQAKTMVCPILETRSHNRGLGSKVQCCIGSICMMWRWERRVEYSKKPPATGPKGEQIGYCGMGGKP